MNPLDKSELSEFIITLNHEMPKHTPNKAEIRYSFSQGMPKDLMELSVKVDNKFLNENQSIIEEINHRDSKQWIPKWFREYQNNIYGDKDILNHDNFFVIDPNSRLCVPTISGGNYHNMLSFSNASLNRGAALGAEVEIGAATTHAFGYNGLICAYPITLVVSSLYDQIAVNSFAAAGTQNLGVYADSSSYPGALIQDTGSLTLGADFNYNSITEFTVTGTANWLAHNADNATWNKWQSASTAGYYKASAYSTNMPDPYPASASADLVTNMKVKHS